MLAIAGGFADVAALGYRQAVGEGMTGWTAKAGQSLLANDVGQEPRYIPGFLEEPLTKSELCVPLKLAGQVIGVLDVQDTRLNAFDETDLLAMETLADELERHSKDLTVNLLGDDPYGASCLFHHFPSLRADRQIRDHPELLSHLHMTTNWGINRNSMTP